MTTKSDKLVDVIVKENLMHMIELSDYVSNNSKELGINKKEINRIVSKNSDYFSLQIEKGYIVDKKTNKIVEVLKGVK